METLTAKKTFVWKKTFVYFVCAKLLQNNIKILQQIAYSMAFTYLMKTFPFQYIFFYSIKRGTNMQLLQATHPDILRMLALSDAHHP
jgi:ABC-type sulfate transport system permease subunit